jgi:hypothetical protein
MWLNVCVLCPEKLFGSRACELFRYVNNFATAVVPLTWIAFGVLIGKYRTLSF